MTTTIELRQEQLNQLYFEIFGEEEHSKAGRPTVGTYPELPDDTLIRKAKLAKNGNEFTALWEGSTLGYNSDDSAADMALMDKLAFWTGGNASQMERLFSRSRLGQRDKWKDRSDYRERTIQKAISSATKFYKPSSTESNGEIQGKTEVEIGSQVQKQQDREISAEELKAIKVPENPRFKTLLEQDNFIQEYIRYGETVTDSYPDYWFAGGTFCLSVAVNKNAVVKLRSGKVHPNLWVNLLGLSSIARKTTVADKTDEIIMAANIDPDCKMPDEFSPEAMIERLDRYPHAYMIKDEAAGLLALMKKDYMRGLKDALMQLYDGKDINRELRTSSRKADKTKFRVKNPYLCLMLATTPGSFAANTELLDVISGWMPRFLHSYPNHAKDRWLPLEEGTQENDTLSAGCCARLIKIRQEFYDLPEARVMHLSPDANTYFTEWQRIREKELVEAKDDRRAQFYSRLAVYVVKLGMLFTIGRADYKEGMDISLDHIKEACRLVDEYFMPMALIVADLVGKAADRNLMDKVIAVLTSRGGKLTRRELMKAIHQKRKDLDEALDALEESGEIRLATVSNPKGPATRWVMLASDNDNSHTVHNVDTVYSSILSQQKEDRSKRDCGTNETVSTNATNGTVWDKKPDDSDSINTSLRDSLTPAQKSSLWSDAAKLIRKNHCRTYKGRKGFTVEDLEKEAGLPAKAIRATLEAAGWSKTDDPCGIIFWATEKALKAMGFEVET